MSSVSLTDKASPTEVESVLRSAVRAVVAGLDARGAGLAPDHGGDGSGVLDVRARLLGLAAPGRLSAGGRCRLVAALDGWIAVSLPRPEDVASVPAWLCCDASEVGADQPTEATWQTVERECASRDRGWLLERSALCGLAVFAVGEFAGAPAVLAHHLGAAPPRPLGGGQSVTVVNLAGLWAGPLAADICARLGAHVVTIDNIARPDGSRATPQFHEWLHSRDHILAVDLTTTAGRAELADTIGRAHVVIEGSRPRALAQMGCDARALTASGPQVWVSITGAGRSAPHDVRIGFGDDAAAGGGIVGWTGEGPVFVADAAADPLAGVTAAAEITGRLDAGGRWLVDVALARVAGSLWR